MVDADFLVFKKRLLTQDGGEPRGLSPVYPTTVYCISGKGRNFRMQQIMPYPT